MAKSSPDSEQISYYHKVVDCQFACPAHTPVPQYIRLIAERRYTEAYMINRRSNVFPGILGRVCDRPCEPACRRGRVEQEPVAICRLKRVAADLKDTDTDSLLPPVPDQKNGKRVALIGAGPASLTVADDLLPLGYDCELFEKDPGPGGAMASQVPAFRLPEKVLRDETDSVIKRGVKTHYNTEIKSLKKLFDQGFDAVFVGTGAPLGKDLKIPGRDLINSGLYSGVSFLANISFGHLEKLQGPTVVIGGGNTAMDCCRSALRLGSSKVRVITPEPFERMLASPWEIKDSLREGISIENNLLPARFQTDAKGRLTGVGFAKVICLFDEEGNWSPETDPDSPPVQIPCSQVILAIGQSLSFPFLDLPDLKRRKDASGRELEFAEVDPVTYQATDPRVFFGGDAAFGPKNIIQAVADGHQAAISIHRFCRGENTNIRPAPDATLTSQKMAMNQWSYANDYEKDNRQQVPHEEKDLCIRSISLEVEKGFEKDLAETEAARCLNCDIQTVFSPPLCIECDACIDICPVECLLLTPGSDSEEELRLRLPQPADNPDQSLYQAPVPQTLRLMIKDENVCLHCGLCAERCPTGAWDMQAFDLKLPHAGEAL